jgi:hypothetical protein
MIIILYMRGFGKSVPGIGGFPFPDDRGRLGDGFNEIRKVDSVEGPAI